jgi:hypothetical protein
LIQSAFRSLHRHLRAGPDIPETGTGKLLTPTFAGRVLGASLFVVALWITNV